MFDSLSNSWELVKASWSVLRSDKELVVFPIVSFFGVILVTISFAIPMFAAGIFQALAESSGSSLTESSAQIVSAIVGFLFYLVVIPSSSSRTRRWSARRSSASVAATRP